MYSFCTLTLRFALGCFLLFLGLGVNAQNAHKTTTRPSATPATLSSSYTNFTLNYIRTWQPSLPTTDRAVVTSAARTVEEVKQIIEYFDGLGRLIQTTSKGMSGGTTAEATGGNDLVNMHVYDALHQNASTLIAQATCEKDRNP